MLIRETVLFRDRRDAAVQLGKMLALEDMQNPLLLGIPRGGVEIAYYAAKELGTGFSVVIAKKLGFPGHEELAFGAIAEDGSIYISPMGRKKLNEEMIERIIEQQQTEIQRRIQKYREGRSLPDMHGRTVIIVDDGIATGSTFIPVIEMCKKQGAAKVIAAAPVGPSENIELLNQADEIKILETPEPFHAVGQFYDDFRDLKDEQVMAFLQEQEKGA